MGDHGTTRAAISGTSLEPADPKGHRIDSRLREAQFGRGNALIAHRTLADCDFVGPGPYIIAEARFPCAVIRNRNSKSDPRAKAKKARGSRCWDRPLNADHFCFRIDTTLLSLKNHDLTLYRFTQATAVTDKNSTRLTLKLHMLTCCELIITSSKITCI